MGLQDLTEAEKKEMARLEEKGEYDSRICLAIYYFRDEADANRYGELVRKAGYTYNGGWFDGKACGREQERDYTSSQDGIRRYAVTC